jgi:uncharacterized protein
MSSPIGKFVWYELMTSNADAASAFYSKVVGWEIKDAGMSDRSYSILHAGSSMVGGLMAIPERAAAMGAKPMWLGYIFVDDADAFADKAKAAGGAIHHGPEDIPGIGRFAVASDPDGAAFILFKGIPPENPPPPPAPGATGTIGWHELHAGDRERAFAFYSGLFGWKKTDTFDMGPMGVYQLFGTLEGQAGGMFAKSPQTPRPFWLYYFFVDGIDAGAERVKAAGGQITNGPHQVPGGLWIVQGVDPQGAMFALLAAKR